MKNEELTGKRRHRTGWRKRLILQVEATGYSSTFGTYGTKLRYWRDATAEDVTEETGE